MSKLKFAAYPAIVLLSLAAALSAHAAGTTGDITVDDSATQVWAHTKTRAQVQQELLAARADGSVKLTSLEFAPYAIAPQTGASTSNTTRAQVQAEVRANRGNEVARMTGEDSGSFYLSQTMGKQSTNRVLAAQR